MQNSTYALFNKRYSGNSDSKIEQLNAEINEFDEDSKKKQDLIDTYNTNILELNERNAELIAEIKNTIMVMK